MAVPELGTYTSEDNNFQIKLISAKPSNGRIKGKYTTMYSPVGEFTCEGGIGNYAWVFSEKAGRDGVVGGFKAKKRHHYGYRTTLITHKITTFQHPYRMYCD